VDRMQQMTKVASLRTIVLGAPLREILKHLASRTVAPDADNLVALLHRPRQSYFLIPQAEKVTVVFPMRYKDSNDVVLATSFLQVSLIFIVRLQRMMFLHVTRSVAVAFACRFLYHR
jgi:actin related protein 2/3 complex subunit 2